MANGIDSIYDPSDVTRMLAELREQRLQMEEDRSRKTMAKTKVSTKAWEMWSGEQTAKTREFIASKDYMYDPKYTEKNWLSRQFTPSGGRVMPTETALSKPDFVDIRGSKTIPESISKTVEPVKKVGTAAGEKVTEATGSTLGKIGAGIGAGVSAYDLVTNWKKKSDVDKGLGIATTGLYAASVINPAFGIYALGSSLLDLVWD